MISFLADWWYWIRFPNHVLEPPVGYYWFTIWLIGAIVLSFVGLFMRNINVGQFYEYSESYRETSAQFARIGHRLFRFGFIWPVFLLFLTARLLPKLLRVTWAVPGKLRRYRRDRRERLREVLEYR